jgi:hypothetical protein
MASKLKVGRFRAIAKEGSETWGEAQTGSPQVGFIMKIDQRPQGLYDVSVYLPMTEKSEDFSIERLRLCGVSGVISPDTPLMGLGKNYVEVDVSVEDFEGKDQVRIEIVVPREEVRMDRKLSASKESALAARLRAKTANGAAERSAEDLAAEA